MYFSSPNLCVNGRKNLIFHIFANNVFLPYLSATSKLRCMLMSWRELINKYVVGAVNHGVARKRRLASHVFTRVLVLHIFLARKPIVIPPLSPVNVQSTIILQSVCYHGRETWRRKIHFAFGRTFRPNLIFCDQS